MHYFELASASSILATASAGVWVPCITPKSPSYNDACTAEGTVRSGAAVGDFHPLPKASTMAFIAYLSEDGARPS